MSRYYNGPVSDHFDGARFFDPHGAPPRSRRDLLRWFVDRHWRATKSKWPAWAPSPYADRPPARIDGAAWRISYVGHASWLIQTAGFNMLLDPVWSKRASPFRFAGPQRVNDPGIAFADLPPIDVVLVSHGHYDHLDLTTLSRLAAAHRARVITPLGNDTIIRNHDSAIRAEAHDWENRVDIGAGIAVTLVAAPGIGNPRGVYGAAGPAGSNPTEPDSTTATIAATTGVRYIAVGLHHIRGDGTVWVNFEATYVGALCAIEFA